MYLHKNQRVVDLIELQHLKNIPKFNQEEARRAFLTQYYKEKIERSRRMPFPKETLNLEQMKLLYRQNIDRFSKTTKKSI